MTRADVVAVACAELFAEDGEILVSPMGTMPAIGARLARRSCAPDIVLTDGEAHLVDADGTIEGWQPFRLMLDTVVPHGRRHVVMGANQVDRHGNQNISAIGPHSAPHKQLLGVRGAPGNTVNHRTSYWVPRHSTRVFVPAVDVVCGVGYNNAAGQPFHDVHRVVTDLAVLDFPAPHRTMRLRSVHPGVSVADVRAATGFELDTTGGVTETRTPTAEELRLLDVVDPDGLRHKEVPA